MEVNLRKAVQTDVQEIAKIHVNSWKSAFDGLMPEDYINGFTVSSRVDEWHRIINHNTETVVVAERGNKVVGFMSYLAPPEEAEIMELSKLYLCPSVYGEKVGSRFLTHLEQESQALGTKTIKLYVLDNNKAAIQFYSKHGFEFADGFISEEFKGSVIVDLLMVKQVKA